MNNRIYVGNLAFHTTEDGLKTEFSRFGGVDEVKLMVDRETGRSRGFAFVTMESGEAAQSAIGALNGAVIDGRPLRVNEAEARPERSFGGGGGGGGSRGGGGGGSRGGGGGGGGRRERW